ncbi:hypothetical protein C2G38_2035597 [Gigaspora rosea]|uniref:Uncharacterized protein n=1 Tax=Gigaspora rosea TaxID=44941 RepID=A0A397VLG2_9GLOM|nr:hypothetical protein C2G38_2035597 [Gigaspora rosea]
MPTTILTMEEPFNNAKFGSNKKQKNGLEVLLKEVKTKCDTLIQKLAPIGKEPIHEPRGKVEGPTWEIFDRIYEVGCKVKKGEDKGVKIGIKLSITYSKFAKVDHMDEMKDLKNY